MARKTIDIETLADDLARGHSCPFQVEVGGKTYYFEGRVSHSDVYWALGKGHTGSDYSALCAALGTRHIYIAS